MIQAIKIELLKSKRTKSLSILFFMMIIASAWQIFVLKSNFKHPDLIQVSTIYNNQTIDCLLLPIMVSIFASKIVSNEKNGQTFKLQKANGKTVVTIFYQKFILMLCTFLLLFIFESAVRYFFASANGIATNFPIIASFFFGQILSTFALISIFLSLSVLLNKQGVVLAIGFLCGFFSIVLSSWSTSLFSFWIPGIGSAYLAPFKLQMMNGAKIPFYSADETLLIRFIIYLIFSLVLFIFTKTIMKKKGGELL